MTTQQTLSSANLPSVFARPLAALPDTAPFQRLVSLNRSPLFHRIAGGIDGWSALVEAHKRAGDILEARPADRPVSPEDAARAILDGQDPSTAIDRISAATEALKRRELFAKVQDAALQEVSHRAEAWVTSHLIEIEDALTADVQAIFDKAASAVGHLQGVHVATDLVEHPLAAVHWAEVARLGVELGEIERNADALRPRHVPGNGPASMWPLAGLIADYPRVWSKYYLAERLETETGEIPDERAPWDDPDRAVVLRHLAELKPIARVRLGRHYREHLDDLAKRAAKDRANLQESIHQEVLRENRGSTANLAPWQPAVPPWPRD
ncbi:hypothetical protein ACFUTX_06780 [Microbacterium sp. NPDC057407]|uniref:hypothetical protein n=1 Tax=Microbacterium sp. NPDC057407 TaxID=3346120 RepID=UPI0036703DF0